MSTQTVHVLVLVEMTETTPIITPFVYKEMSKALDHLRGDIYSCYDDEGRTDQEREELYQDAIQLLKEEGEYKLEPADTIYYLSRNEEIL